MQMHLRIARLQRAQQIFVIADLQVRMQPALEQNSGAAEFQHFVDFLVNLLERKDVAVLGAERPVEGAKRTILGAEIRVVDVAVGLVGDHAWVVFLQAHLVRGHAEAHEVIGFEHVESLLFCQSHNDPSRRYCCNPNESMSNPETGGASPPPTTSRPLLSRRPTRAASLAGSGLAFRHDRSTTPGRGGFLRRGRSQYFAASTIRACARAIPTRAPR